MMKSLILLIGVVVAPMTGLAVQPSSQPDADPQSDVDKLQGTWINREGRLTKVLVVSGTHFASIFEFKDGIRSTQARISIDVAGVHKPADRILDDLKPLAKST